MIFYKYYSFSSGIAALSSQKLGFREPKYFNDPFELSYLNNSSDSNFIEDKMNSLKKSLVILSLTKTYSNPLMWAHYGEDHKGFVIGYDIDDDFFLSQKYNVITAAEGKVSYTNKKEKIIISEKLKNVLHEIYLIGEGKISSHLKSKLLLSILKKALLYKHSSWAYEEEVRVIKVLDSKFKESEEWQSDPNRAFSSFSKSVAPGIETISIPGLYLFNKEVKIKEVYLGMRNPLLSPHIQTSDPIESRDIYEQSKKHSWCVKKMSMASGSWELEGHDINRELLMIRKQTRGLIRSLAFSGLEAEYLCRTLPLNLDSVEDRYELTNWYDRIELKRNGEFVT